VTEVYDKDRARQRHRAIIILVITLVVALVLEAGFYLGQRAAFAGMGAKPKTYRAMQEELLSIQNALQSRDAELAIQRTRNEVDRQALELVRKDMAGQKEDMARLEEGLEFYRSLISPGELAPGISLRKLELLSGKQPRQYEYRIVVQQEARNYEQLNGTLSVEVSGLSSGKQVTYPLGELSEDIDGEGASLRFTYFQSIQGRLLLPAGFEPQSVTVVARTLAPHQLEIREAFPWQLQERFTHVGK
jgi:hypothetical protein